MVSVGVCAYVCVRVCVRVRVCVCVCKCAKKKKEERKGELFTVTDDIDKIVYFFLFSSLLCTCGRLTTDQRVPILHQVIICQAYVYCKPKPLAPSQKNGKIKFDDDDDEGGK